MGGVGTRGYLSVEDRTCMHSYQKQRKQKVMEMKCDVLHFKLCMCVDSLLTTL